MRQLATAAAVLLVLAVPVLTWWLVGDQSTTGPDNADYVLPPLFRVSRRATRALGTGALAVTVVAAALLIGASASHSFDLSWWSVVGPLLLLGILLSLGWRVFTAGVVGANIGAGLFVFIIGPVILALVAWVIFRTISLVN
ncbi:MAG TPA: hypothetical protein VNW50_12545 [Streptosporangiaceae bacterium]|jgi:hypothetical protein|nr:hypothetical protein [Streptosporangiaceae bacterium]